MRRCAPIERRHGILEPWGRNPQSGVGEEDRRAGLMLISTGPAPHRAPPFRSPLGGANVVGPYEVVWLQQKGCSSQRMNRRELEALGSVTMVPAAQPRSRRRQDRLPRGGERVRHQVRGRPTTTTATVAVRRHAAIARLSPSIPFAIATVYDGAEQAAKACD